MAEEWRLEPTLEKYRFREYFSFDITPYASLAVFEPGELILREGQRVTRLYYLVRGRAKLFTTLKNGKVTLFNFYEVPSFLGEMEMLDPEAHTKGVRAHTRCYCIALDLTRCGERVLNDPRFLRAICLYLGRKAMGNSWHYAQSQSYPLKYRLASYILFTSRDGVYAEPHTEAAEYLGHQLPASAVCAGRLLPGGHSGAHAAGVPAAGPGAPEGAAGRDAGVDVAGPARRRGAGNVKFFAEVKGNARLLRYKNSRRLFLRPCVSVAAQRRDARPLRSVFFIAQQ